MKKHVLFILSSLLLTTFLSCKREVMIDSGIITQATLFNKSGVQVTHKPYYMDRPMMDYIVDLAHNDSLLYGRSFEISEGKVPGFSSLYGTGRDSIQIIYNNMYIITHVRNISDTLLLPHQLSYKNEKNMFNPYNYNWWFVEETRNLYHEFTFTAEDYEYAQEHGLKVE